MVIDEDCLNLLTLWRPMVSARMGDLIEMLMEHKLIDAIIITGANII